MGGHEKVSFPPISRFIGGNMWIQQNGTIKLARRPGDARGHKRGNTVRWVWNQNNNSVSAVQMRPCCSVPARYWLFECFCVSANLDRSGTEDTASQSTVYCSPTAVSHTLCKLHPAWTRVLFSLVSRKTICLHLCISLCCVLVRGAGQRWYVMYSPAIVPWTHVAAEIAQLSF